MDSIEKLNDPSLPIFKSEYWGKVSEDEYIHALSIFNEYNCKSMSDYTKLYCEIGIVSIKTDVVSYLIRSLDVYLLCEVFELFRKNSLEYYQLGNSFN